MADFALPVLTSTYSDMVNVLKDRDLSSMKLFDGTTDSNLPSGTKRWNSTNNYFEKFDGSAWSALTTKYMINVDLLDGCTVNDSGTTATDLWTANKITAQLATKLNSSEYTANNILAKLVTVDGSGSGLDADLLDGLDSSMYLRNDGWDSSPGMNANTQADMKVDFTYANNAPYGGPLVKLGVNEYSLQLNAAYTSSSLAFRTKNGDNTTWNAWKYLATTDGTVAAATTAGSCTGNSATATKLNPISGDANYKLAYTADGQRTNPGEWGRVVMRYEPNSQTYGVRVDKADYADSSGSCSGNATTASTATKANTINVSGNSLTFNWVGQSGQPAWLFGSNNSVDAYVWNPSNFSVNYANSAGNGTTAQSFGSSGYIRFGNGFIMQWGTASQGHPSTGYFPITFPNAALQAVATSSVIASNSFAVVSSFNTSSITLYNNNNGGTIRWLVLGY